MGLCETPTFDYNEIRVLFQDWDSAIFTTWIMQIVLSELVRVPVSVETSSPELVGNFYDPANRFDYGGASYNYEALETARRVKDCRLVEDGRPCGHIMPEVWSGQRDNVIQAERERLIEPAEGTGGVAKYSWYVPRFVAEMDHSLLSHFGMRGEQGRRKLARTFHRPTNWKEYCNLVSTDGCTTPDNVTQRAPRDDEEGERYFVEGSYRGHFRPTFDNDCDNNVNCTGHITNVICSWTTFVVPQAYHNGIAVKSNGPDANGGYPFLRMLEIWRAANATKSPVLMYWFTPDPMLQEFLGTESEFQKVLLPAPSQECIDSRVSSEDRCAVDSETQIGSAIGACDSEAHTYLKLIVDNLFEEIAKVPIERRSPTYDAVKRFRLSDLQVDQMFRYWYGRDTDRWGYDPREAACRWVNENLDDLGRFVPRSYPRVIQRESVYSSPLHTFGLAMGSAAVVCTCLTGALVYVFRQRRVLRNAQVEFVFMLVCGLLLVAIGSVLVSAEPSHSSCVVLSWVIMLGYTMELVPLIIKAAAINRVMEASRRMKKVNLRKKTLFGSVALLIILTSVFLALWTAWDPLTKQEVLSLSQVQAGHKLNEVRAYYFCGSDRSIWMYSSVGWHVLLLLCATVLAFQTRHVVSDFDESRLLGFMVYSHFVFVLFRLVIIILQDDLSAAKLSGFLGMVYSVDTLATLMIYFVPKFVIILKGEDTNTRQTRVFMRPSWIQQARERISRRSSQPGNVPVDVPHGVAGPTRETATEKSLRGEVSCNLGLSECAPGEAKAASPNSDAMPL